MKHIWLFTFTSYSYCQGTKYANYNDLRLLTFTLPCDEQEAIHYLATSLEDNNIEFDYKSIKSLSINITNS